MREFTIQKNDSGQRADKFILKVTQGLPASLLYKGFRKKRIKLNGKKCEPSTMLQVGDILEAYLNDEFFGEIKSASPPAFLNAKAELSLLYEDENLLLIDKEAGLASHEGGSEPDTLIARVKRYLYEQGEYDPGTEQSFAPALCNRLDQYTGGIVIAAKNAAALREMSERIRLGQVKKEYLCIALGPFERDEALLTAYLKKDETKNMVTVRDTPAPGYREIKTRYQVLREKGELSLLNTELITGRTHQIRAHLAHEGHPLLGDGKYGDRELNRRHHCQNQCLFAYRLTFDFPDSEGVLGKMKGQSFQIRSVPFVSRFFGEA